MKHYNDVIMRTMASQITSLTIVFSTVYSGTDQIKHQSSASLAFVRGIDRWPANSPHRRPVTRKMFPFDDVIMMIVVMKLHSQHQQSCGRCNSGSLLPPNLVKSRSHEIGCYNDCFALKFDRHLGSTTAKVPVKFQSDWKRLNPNLAASRLREILR